MSYNGNYGGSYGNGYGSGRDGGYGGGRDNGYGGNRDGGYSNGYVKVWLDTCGQDNKIFDLLLLALGRSFETQGLMEKTLRLLRP